MKFYYDNKLIRTSKSHAYTHALIDQNCKAVTCSATREGCEKEHSRLVRKLEQIIQNRENALAARAAGKTQVKWLDGRKTYYLKLNERRYLDEFSKYIEADRKRLHTMIHDWKIVELEAR